MHLIGRNDEIEEEEVEEIKINDNESVNSKEKVRKTVKSRVN